MITWIAEHWLDLTAGAAVLGLVALCLKNLLPRKGKSAACAGCSGSCGSCGGCSSCGGSCH